MASFVPAKMKRKGLGEVFDDFSDFSLSAPATKIRRLDAEFSPTLEEQMRVGVIGQKVPKEEMADGLPDTGSVMKKDAVPPILNEERALILYKPLLAQSVPSLKINPELISGLKNHAFWLGNHNMLEEDYGEDQQSSSTNSLAVIPWVPSQFPAPGFEASTSGSGPVEETMEAGWDVESMEIEGDCGQFSNTGVGDESIHQWQQHCMIPELPQTASSPIMGSCIIDEDL